MAKAVVMRRAINDALDESPGTPRQRRMWALAGAGIGLDGYDLFVMSAAIPVLRDQFGVSSPVLAAWFGGAAVVGAIPGALVSGILADRFGRRVVLRIDLLIFALTAVLCALAWNPLSLIAFRVVQGFAIGAEYPISAAIVAEVMPRRTRGRWMTAAFSFQAVGMILAAAVSTAVLMLTEDPSAWRWMLLSGVVPALVVGVLRQGLPESPRWLARKGRIQEAMAALEWVLGPEAVDAIRKQRRKAKSVDEGEGRRGRLPELFSRRFRRRTALAAIPWLLMDVALYGVGMFTPVILLTVLASGAASDGASFLHADIEATASSAAADVFLVVGFLINIALVERVGRIPMQILGFGGMAAGALIVAAGSDGGQATAWAIAGFMIFNLMLNAGPNATTYLIPAEVFPTRLRTTGHGFAAASGKIGATVGVFALPAALAAWGLTATMIGVALVCVVGAALTVSIRVESGGLALD